jgi:2-isopropylmalate synthase
MEHSDGVTSWNTVGVAPNIVEASWVCLTEGITYGLLRRGIEAR